MKRTVALLLLICMIAIPSLSACQTTSPQPAPETDSEPSGELYRLLSSPEAFQALDDPDLAVSEELVQAYQHFAYEFVKTVQQADPDSNICLSPFSAFMAFALCYAGSQSVTAEEFQTVFGMTKAQGTAFAQSLLSYFQILADRQGDKQAKVNLANSVWINKDYEPYVKEDYLKTAGEKYKASIFSLNFQKDDALTAINNWCSDQTDGLVKEILDELNPDAVMVLINALLVEAAWREQYEDYQVTHDKFTCADGHEVDASYLCKTIGTCYISEDAKAFKMPLEAGFSFVAILPEEGITAKEYLSTLTSEKAGRLLSEKTYCAVKTRIPQFQLDYAIDLNEVMPVMGLRTGYHPTQADFSAMIEIPDHNVYIYESIQKTHFELDQNGIKAAAVTAIVMDKEGSGMMGKEIELFLDRPFVYMLIHESSGIVLFEGIMNDLSK